MKRSWSCASENRSGTLAKPHPRPRFDLYPRRNTDDDPADRNKPPHPLEPPLGLSLEADARSHAEWTRSRTTGQTEKRKQRQENAQVIGLEQKRFRPSKLQDFNQRPQVRRTARSRRQWRETGHRLACPTSLPAGKVGDPVIAKKGPCATEWPRKRARQGLQRPTTLRRDRRAAKAATARAPAWGQDQQGSVSDSRGRRDGGCVETMFSGGLHNATVRVSVDSDPLGAHRASTSEENAPHGLIASLKHKVFDVRKMAMSFDGSWFPGALGSHWPPALTDRSCRKDTLLLTDSRLVRSSRHPSTPRAQRTTRYPAAPGRSRTNQRPGLTTLASLVACARSLGPQLPRDRP